MRKEYLAWARRSHPDRGGDSITYAAGTEYYQRRIGQLEQQVACPPPAIPQKSVPGVELFVAPGCARASFFDAVLLGDSLGRSKTLKKKCRWYLGRVVAALQSDFGVSACAAATAGCRLLHPEDTFLNLVDTAPPGRVCVLEVAGNDFLGNADFRKGPSVVHAVEDLVPALRAKYAQVLVVLVGSEESWRYKGYKSAGLYDERMDELRRAFQSAGVPVCRTEMLGVRLADSTGHILDEEESVAKASDTWLTWYRQATEAPLLATVASCEVAWGTARRRKLNVRIKDRLSKLEGVDQPLFCEACEEWRGSSGFAQHACCLEASTKGLDRLLCFAAAQASHHDESWRRYGKLYPIKDFVIAEAPWSSKRFLLELQESCRAAMCKPAWVSVHREQL